MAQPWLDSLSEDWVSLPGSDASQSAPTTSIKSTRRPSDTTSGSASSNGWLFDSVKRAQAGPASDSSNILSERSANEINIFGSRRIQSKLSQELKFHESRGRPRRSLSASTSMAGSVVHNTMHKSHSASPGKTEDTPEWRRRLIHGDLAYGEQRDLFSSARVSLENMFNPPPPGAQHNKPAADGAGEEEGLDALEEVEEVGYSEDRTGDESRQPYDDLPLDSTMPSSPPIRQARYDSFVDSYVNESAQELPQQPHGLSTLTEEAGSILHHGHARPTSEDDDSEHQDSQSVPDQSGSALSAADSVHVPMERESRMVSGQSVLRNESFSAIVISPEKNSSGDGAVFGNVELPSGELKQRLQNLRWNQMTLAGDAGESAAVNQSASIGGKSLNAENTEEYEKMGGFINFRRGGRSADSSFRDRLLSPSLGTDTSEMLPEESLQASTPKQFPTIRTEYGTMDKASPDLPRVPNPSPAKNLLQVSGGSPLKLFGPYDTFTNQTLMRRISQFEDQMSNGSHVSADRTANSGDEPSRSELEQHSQRSQQSARAATQNESRQSSAQFGAGELNGYSFRAYPESHSSSEAPRQEPEKRQSVLKLSSHSARQDGTIESQQGELFIQRMRKSGTADSSKTTSRPHTAERSTAATSQFPLLSTPQRGTEPGSEKRPRTSPSKDPTPKRRRTLHKSDIAFGFEEHHTTFDSVQKSHEHMLSAASQRRRDAGDGEKSQFADTDISHRRQIRRPRTPTPSQRSSVMREENPDMANSYDGFSIHDGTVNISPSASRKRPSALRTEIRADDAEVAAKVPAAEGERKPSIRTEDFMNEAHKIMEMLRSRGGGVQSGLTSVEESEMETPQTSAQQEESDGSFQESTREPFSRPPSREGNPIPRMARMQDDPELVARLRQYEERSDLDDLVSSTARSVNLAQEAIRTEQEAELAVQGTLGSLRSHTDLEGDEVISDPPNIRISINPGRQSEGMPSQVMHASVGSVSSGTSTNRSIPTASSRSSDTRRTIAPQTVSHLIPDQVGNMVLDRNRNIWIKRRTASADKVVENVLPSEGSEEDPFADIPDLSVDETLEMKNLKKTAVPGLQTIAEGAPAGPPPRSDSPAKTPGPTLITKSSMAALAGDAHADEGQLPLAAAAQGDVDVDGAAEHEISIDEGRVAQTPTPLKKRQLAISFSSPVASIIQDFVMASEDDDDADDDASTQARLPEEAAAEDVSSARRGRRMVSVKFKSTGGSGRGRSSSSRGAMRQFSVGGRAFVPRPISRIEEREEDNAHSWNQELSIVGGGDGDNGGSGSGIGSGDVSQLAGRRSTSVSFVVATPGRATREEDEQAMAQYVGMLSLSPMSEFTIHQERSLALEASYVLGERHLATGDGSKTVMSQSLRDLVEGIAEVEPFEPYWEDMEALAVPDKRLESLHKLESFCPQLVTLDASGNALRSVAGVPSPVRHLKIASNRLSELTSWTHLANLQYVDISHNAVKTLSGLRHLVHLRGLRADGCGLANLDGIKYHEGLQTLRARGNGIAAVDFDGTRLQKLVELDLEDNAIATASHLQQLGALAVLNLRRNELEAFGPHGSGEGAGTAAMGQLRTLNVSDNQLTTLDIRGLPELRVLHADRNRLTRVRGFSKTPRLDSVSLREQRLGATERLEVSSVYHAYEIRKLYLSGNYLAGFDPPVVFLNLQLLELANCGLTSLPGTLGLMLPNVRKLNLNFNAMTELRSLRGIPRLKKVLVAGNRLGRAHAVMRTLAEFRHLAEVDLRDNPMTQGFYAHTQALVSSSSNNNTENSKTPAEPFTLPSGDVEQDQAYCSRLDLPTGMRRRVYEQVFGDACPTLKRLDGLPVRREVGAVRDAVWAALKDKGIVGESTEAST